MVDRVDCGIRDSLEAIVNNSAGYTGSTGAREGRELVISAGVRAGLGGTGGPDSRFGLDALVPGFGMVSVRRLISLRRSRRIRTTPKIRMMRVTTDEETERAMIADLMKTVSLAKLAIANIADLDIPWTTFFAGDTELGRRHPLGLDGPPPTKRKFET